MKTVREEEMKLRGKGFVTQVGFKAGVKERGGVMDEQIDESKEEEVIGKGPFDAFRYLAHYCSPVIYICL